MNIPSPQIWGPLNQSLWETQLSALWLTGAPGVSVESDNVLALLDCPEKRTIDFLRSQFQKRFLQSMGIYRQPPADTVRLPKLHIFERKFLYNDQEMGARSSFWSDEDHNTLRYLLFPDTLLESRLYLPDENLLERLSKAADPNGDPNFWTLRDPEYRKYKYSCWPSVKPSIAESTWGFVTSQGFYNWDIIPVRLENQSVPQKEEPKEETASPEMKEAIIKILTGSTLEDGQT